MKKKYWILKIILFLGIIIPIKAQGQGYPFYFPDGWVKMEIQNHELPDFSNKNDKRDAVEFIIMDPVGFGFEKGRKKGAAILGCEVRLDSPNISDEELINYVRRSCKNKGFKETEIVFFEFSGTRVLRAVYDETPDAKYAGPSRVLCFFFKHENRLVGIQGLCLAREFEKYSKIFQEELEKSIVPDFPPLPSLSPNLSWNTYNFEAYNFSFQYPFPIKVTSPPDLKKKLKLLNIPRLSDLNLLVCFLFTNRSLADLSTDYLNFMKNTKNYSNIQSTDTETSLSGVPAVFTKGSMVDKNGRSWNIKMLNAKDASRWWSIVLSYPATDLKLAAAADQVIQSFKIYP